MEKIEPEKLEKIECPTCLGVGKTRGAYYMETLMYGNGKLDEYPCRVCNSHGFLFRLKDKK